MEYTDFIKLVASMMDKQQEYFKCPAVEPNRKRDLLIQSKELEKQVRYVMASMTGQTGHNLHKRSRKFSAAASKLNGLMVNLALDRSDPIENAMFMRLEQLQLTFLNWSINTEDHENKHENLNH